MLKENRYMNSALEIAFEHFGRTSPNPSVGAVIVKDDKIIASGGTCSYGKDHAEIIALKDAEKTYGADFKETLKGSEMYVTLEPCAHFGKTPPCTSAIIESGISRVYIPILDPNSLVSGKGVSALQDAGVEVVMLDEMSEYAADIIRPFKKYISREKPFIIYKSAVSLDGRIASESGDSKWISSEYSRYIVHKLRAKIDAVIIGKNTYSKDSPLLNVRMETFDEKVKDYFDNDSFRMNGRDNFFIKRLLESKINEYNDPLRVVIGLPENINFSSKFFDDDHYMFFIRKEELDRVFKEDMNYSKQVEKLNNIIIDCKSNEEQINKILDELANRGIMTAMLEGGSNIAGAFTDAGEIDQFIYFVTPRIIGKGLNSINSKGVKEISQSYKLKDVSSLMIQDDILYNAYME